MAALVGLLRGMLRDTHEMRLYQHMDEHQDDMGMMIEKLYD